MKKRSVFSIVAVLGAAAAYVSYKVKKEVDREMIDLDEGLLDDRQVSNPTPSTPSVSDTQYSHLNEDNIAAITKTTEDAIEELARQGDNHETERPIQQMAVFSTSEDEAAFRQEIMRKGYVVSKGENPLEDVILHISRIEGDKVLASVLVVANEVKKYNGKYNGWKSKIVE